MLDALALSPVIPTSKVAKNQRFAGVLFKKLTFTKKGQISKESKEK